ncbi:MAG: C25 family cysteine peptidase [Candidatus Neomarinimicrobiota bacterium]
MIKRFSLMLVLLFSILIAGEYSYEFNFSRPDFVQKNGHFLLEMEGCMQGGVGGEPLLPHHAFSILLPPGETLGSIELKTFNKRSYPLMLELLPKQPDRPLSMGKSGKFFKKELIYEQEKYLSRNIKADVQYLGGAAIVSGAIIPMEYFPKQRKIDLSEKLELIIKTIPNGQGLKLNANSIEKLKSFINNPEILNEYLVSTIDESESMLIISSKEYETVFDTLIAHYAKYGIRTEFMPISDIYKNYSGIDTPEIIRNAIKEFYIQNGLDYVLIGGNTGIVPTRGLSCEVNSGGEILSSDNIASDLYYVALDGNWDSNGNGIYGEYNDSTGFDEADLFPELSIGRFPAANLEEMQNMINKSLRYQLSPIVDEMDKHVFFGEFLYHDPLSWASDYMELLIGYREDNGYKTQGLPENLRITKWYDEDSLSFWNEATVKEELASGYSFLHHDGHANTDYMMKFSYHELNDSDFVSVNGIDHTRPIFYSHGCNCGGFDLPNCIASKIVTSPYISVGGVFNSRYGWFNEGQTEGPSIHLHREFENAIYGQHYTHFGKALTLSRIATVPWVTALGQHEQNALRWNFYTINVLGDPAMRIYSQRPVEAEINYDLSQLHLAQIKAQIFKDGYAMENAGLAVLDTSGQLLAFAESDASGSVTVNLPTAPLDGEVLTCYVSGENILLSDTTIVSAKSSIDPLDSYALLSTYPNPFNPDVTVSFSIPEELDVNINLYDMSGKFVDKVFSNKKRAGTYEIVYHAKDLPSGIYLCRMDLGKTAITRKIILLK